LSLILSVRCNLRGFAKASDFVKEEENMHVFGAELTVNYLTDSNILVLFKLWIGI
jgi:hypothetical protein